MQNKDEIPRWKAWLILLASLLDDAALVVLIFLGLWFFHVKITWVIILVMGLAVAAFFFIMHHAVIPGLRRRKITGAEGMLGAVGVVTEKLGPQGMIKIKDELWEAMSLNGEVSAGEKVQVVGMKGLVLQVKRQRPG